MIDKLHDYALKRVMILATLTLPFAYGFYTYIGNLLVPLVRKRMAAKSISK